MKVTFHKELINKLATAFDVHSKLSKPGEKSQVISFDVEGIPCVIKLRVRDTARYNDGSEVHPLMRASNGSQEPSHTETYMVGNMTLGRRIDKLTPGLRPMTSMCSTKTFIGSLLQPLGETINYLSNSQALLQLRNGVHAHAVRNGTLIAAVLGELIPSPVTDETGAAVINFPNNIQVKISARGIVVNQGELEISRFESILDAMSTHASLLSVIADIVSMTCGQHVRPAREVDLDINTYMVHGVLYQDLKTDPLVIEPYFSDERGTGTELPQTLYDKPAMMINTLDPRLNMPVSDPTNYNFNPYGAVPNFNPYTGNQGF